MHNTYLYFMGLNVKIFMKSTHFPPAEVLFLQKELELGLFYSQCQWFIVHPLESILWYNCHTQVITELPLEGKKKGIFVSDSGTRWKTLAAGLGWVSTYKIKWASSEKICVRSGNCLIPVLQMLLEKSIIPVYMPEWMQHEDDLVDQSLTGL